MEYGASPVENQNKGYAKQEKQDLLNDNPIAKDASGGRGGSWMSKHSQSKIGGGSPLHNQGDPGHKKKFNYGDGLDKERTKKHKKKVDHEMDGSHSTMIKTTPNKKLDPMYNGKEGVQKDDFEQFKK